jgi:hypothetical protein
MANQEADTYLRNPAFRAFTDHADTWPTSWPTDPMLAAIPRDCTTYSFPQNFNMLLKYVPVEDPSMAGPYFSLAACRVSQVQSLITYID